MKYVEAEYLLFSLPPRKWKMRMQLSAPWFVEKLKELPSVERRFDVVLCSTFVDVAVLRSLLTVVPGWDQKAKFCTYFHENQFGYPDQFDDPGKFQFTAINFNTAIASDSLAFNSEYNRNSFLHGCRTFLKQASDMKLPGLVEEIHNKSCVLYPGVDFTTLDEKNAIKPDVPIIVWNHRWEHDKQPELFFKTLLQLKKKGKKFSLIVLGQSFTKVPSCFPMASEVFKEELLHFGFAPSREEYEQLLCKGAIVVSTAVHEFYGISVIEAVRAGCVPVLPNRLSYPELFNNKEYLYEEGRLEKVLSRKIVGGSKLDKKEAQKLTDKFSWSTLAPFYSRWLFA